VQNRSKISEIKSDIQRESSHPPTSSDSLGLSPQIEGGSQPRELQKLFSQKAQITSIAGLPPTTRERYRVLLGDEILGDFLNLNEAIELARLNRRKNTLS